MCFAIWFFLTKHFIRHNSLYTLTMYSQVYKEVVEICSPCVINVKFRGNEAVKNSFYRDILTSLIDLIQTVSSKSKSHSITTKGDSYIFLQIKHWIPSAYFAGKFSMSLNELFLLSNLLQVKTTLFWNGIAHAKAWLLAADFMVEMKNDKFRNSFLLFP